MKTYLDMLKYVIRHGKNRQDRTGVGTRSIFGYQARYDLQKGFPAVTTKKLMFKSVVVELLWFLRGDTNVAYLQEHGVNIWNEWADTQGNLGPIYGFQWRSWPDSKQGCIDQIKYVIEQIKTDPYSRRIIVSAWNVSMLDQMALPPCHTMFQFYVSDGKLSCHLYQRSGDIFLGIPFNIASYSLLTTMMAQVTNLQPGEFIHTIGDLHLYLNHREGADIQLKRQPLPLPQIKLNDQISNIDDFTLDDIQLVNYQHHDPIKATIAV